MMRRYEPKPWDIRRCDMVRAKDGEFVRYDDASAEINRLTFALAEVEALELQHGAVIARLIEENRRLREALNFYADIAKYPAPLTGGSGELYFDCGQVARAALTQPQGDRP